MTLFNVKHLMFIIQKATARLSWKWWRGKMRHGGRHSGVGRKWVKMGKEVGWEGAEMAADM